MLTPDHVWLALAPMDMRCGIDRLTQYVTDHLNQAWQDEAAFVFCNKTRSRIKVLRWDGHGVWLCMRRLHRGHFSWPRTDDTHWVLSFEQFSWLIKGVNWQQVEGIQLSHYCT